VLPETFVSGGRKISPYSQSFELTPAILEQFRTESNENIAQAESAIGKLSKTEEAAQSIHELFRSIHTIKGSADYLGFGKLKELSHAFESVLDHFRKIGIKKITSQQQDVFLSVLDVISDLVTSAPNESDTVEGLCNKWISALEKLHVPGVEADKQGKSLNIFKDTLKQQFLVLTRAKDKVLDTGKIDPATRGMVSRAIQCITHASQYLGEEGLAQQSCEFKSWVLSPTESKEPAEFTSKIDRYLASAQASMDEADAPQSKEAGYNAPCLSVSTEIAGPNEFASLSRFAESKTVRVDQHALDEFMNLVGELVVARNTFTHIQTQFLGTEDERLHALKDFRESSARLTQITAILQRKVMEMRMIPVRTLFERYPKIARDIARKQAKSVDIFFEGDETEIDKAIADQIAEPLIHLVRNAVDHGIESQAERRRAGKSEVGALTLKASQQGNFMVIEVADDGAGIKIDAIKERIQQKGLLTPEELQCASDMELLNHIFTPGFTTAASVTDISGRGVGLDVVKTNLKKVKGSVTLTTEVGRGTCFRLEVPLTMTIMKALLVKSGSAIYALELQDVTETMKIRRDELKSIYQRNAITVRGEVIMVRWLSEILGHSDISNLAADVRLPILILRGNGKKFGIIVDSVFKQEEIVVKPLPDSYLDSPGLSGVSILGDGKAILILDSNQLGCEVES
jgi:two-component system chemotaxis sensor kinase CheA